jgi:dUTP pyrophosphatase
MKDIDIAIKRLHPELGKSIPMPTRMSTHAAGFDLAAAIDAPIVLSPMQRMLIPCGFAMAIPPGFEAQVRPRSGLALKHGLTVMNAPGTIDADYRGEVKVLLVNLSDTPFTIYRGERIAQMVFASITTAALEVVLELDTTSRGAGGFGSTGV